MGTQKELIHLAKVISRLMNDQRWIWIPQSKIHFVDSQLSKYLKVKAFAFEKTIHFVSTKPSAPCAEASWSVLDFCCYSLQTKTNKH